MKIVIPIVFLILHSTLTGCTRATLIPTPYLPPTSSSTPIPAPTTTISSLQTVSCGIPVPEGVKVTCSDFTVPEDRSQLDGREISLRVAIIHAQNPQPALEPILVLNGGPGGNTLDMIWYWVKAFGSVLAERDVIVFDQRGVGYSRPSLACPEVLDKYYQDMGENLTSEEINQRGDDALQACHDRLVGEGINLASYTSAASAADVNDLRLALGYSEWNIYGISYGTRLALTVLRDFPQGVRSVILDSTYPPQVDLYAQQAVNAERAFNVLFERCSADDACNQAYPDLKNVFYNLVDQLDANPLTIQVMRPATGQNYPIVVNGDRLVSQLFGLLYATDTIPSLPKLIYDLRNGQTQKFADLLRIIFSGDYTSLGMQYSVQCTEDVPFTSASVIQAATEKVTPRIRAALDTSFIIRSCTTWATQPAPEIENMPVTSAIPTLILAGEFDPITPPAWGRLTAETLPNSFLYEFSGFGHGVLGQGVMNFACSHEIVDAFLADPDSKPDGTCSSRYKVKFMSDP